MKVVLCTPGRSFTKDFLMSFVRLSKGMRENGIASIIVPFYAANVFQVRNSILGVPKYLDKPAPFRNMEYDYMLWIDSDMTYSYQHFEALLARDVDLISALYLKDENEYTAVTDFMPAKGSWRFVKRGEYDYETQPQEVDWVGMGFMLIKRGVVEKLGYPWFKARTVSNGLVEQDASEDASFCLDLKDRGVKILVDPLVRVGHLKERILE